MAIKEKLFRAFVDRGIVKEQETEVKASFQSPGLGDQIVSVSDYFVLQKILTVTPKTKLALARSHNGQRIDTGLDSILEIDGMSPGKLAEAFDYNIDGTPAVYHFETKTDYKKDINGKKTYTLPNGFYLQDGMRILFSDDKDPDANNIPFTVRGVGRAIELKKPRGRPKTHLD